MRRYNNPNHQSPSAADRLQWKTEREAIIGQLITDNTNDSVLQGAVVLEHVHGSCYKVWANSQSFFASHNKSKNLWKLWSDK